MPNDTPSLKSALHSAEKEHWQAAIAEELESLEAAGTWVLTEQQVMGPGVQLALWKI
jgi:hypothetical protein